MITERTCKCGTGKGHCLKPVRKTAVKLTKTPRTDQASFKIYVGDGSDMVVEASYARKLEREVQQLKQQLKWAVGAQG